MSASILVASFYAVLMVCAVDTIVYLFVLTRFISGLRDSHHDVYVKLGEPSLFLNNSITNSTRLVGFILRGQFLSLDDKSLSRLGRVCRALLIIAFVGFALCWVASMFYWKELHM